MGLGSYITLINFSAWSWTRTYIHSYQMNDWDDTFPESIEPYSVAKVYVERSDNIADTNSDDAGEVSYGIDDLGGSFQLRYSVDGDSHVFVNFVDLETLNNPVGNDVELGWFHDGETPFIFASPSDSSTNNLVSSNPPEDWMHQTYDRISCLPLRAISMPGTHDSGMSEFNAGGDGSLAATGGATPATTLTQNLNMYEQLQNGARWFDIRPVISGGGWWTGHYSYGVGSWHGAQGQSIDDIIDQINDFTATHNELIIIELTHGYDTDNFNFDEDNHLDQSEWDDLMNRLLSVNFRATGLADNEDITMLPVSTFIDDSASVIFVVDDSATGDAPVDIGDYANEGFFTRDQYYIFNSYSDTNDLEDMTADQLQKLDDNRNDAYDWQFLLSYTLTQPITEPIIENAEDANAHLWANLATHVSGISYPNVICVDAFPSTGRHFAAFSMAINHYLAPPCA